MDAILDMLSRSVEQLFARSTGPLNFRLVVMPTVVTILAIRAHFRDVREGKPIFLGAFIKSPTERRRLFRSGPPALTLPDIPAADYLRLLPSALAIVAILLCEGLLSVLALGPL